MKNTRQRSLAKADYQKLALFRYRLRRLFYYGDEAARQVGLTLQQHQALLAIRGFPGRDEVLVGELAEQLQIRHHSAVGLVDRLEVQGLVSRRSGEKDRRRVWVSLTEEGRDALEKLTVVHRKELELLEEGTTEFLKPPSSM
jgi:DNA-binding MarR family transcriptional regulator